MTNDELRASLIALEDPDWDAETERLRKEAEERQRKSGRGRRIQTKTRVGKQWVTEEVEAPDEATLFGAVAQHNRRNEMANPRPPRGVRVMTDDQAAEQMAKLRREVEALMAPVERIQREMEEKWGINRLPSLVSEDMARRFAAAQAKLYNASALLDPDQTQKRAEIMRRGWEALDKAATEAGHEPLGDPEVWEGRRPDGQVFLICKTRIESASRHRRDGVSAWTLDEIGRVLQAYDEKNITQDIKNAFDAELKGVNAAEPGF